MKPLIILSTILLLPACSPRLNVSGPGKVDTVFRSNVSATHSSCTLDLKHNECQAIVTRTKFKHEIDTAVGYDLFYFHTDNIMLDENNLFRIIDPIRKVWFVSFLLGTEAFLIDPKQVICWKYFCNCGGIPPIGFAWENTGPCEPSATELKIECNSNTSLTPCDDPSHTCVAFAARVVCDHDFLDPELYHELYYGGAFIEADELEIIDPALEHARRTTLMFVFDKDGNLVLERDKHLIKDD